MALVAVPMSSWRDSLNQASLCFAFPPTMNVFRHGFFMTKSNIAAECMT